MPTSIADRAEGAFDEVIADALELNRTAENAKKYFFQNHNTSLADSLSSMDKFLRRLGHTETRAQNLRSIIKLFQSFK